MLRITTWIAIAAIAPAVFAQDKAPPVDASAQFDKLNSEFNNARMDWFRAEAKAARENGRRAIRMVPTEVIAEYAPKFAAAAKEHKGTDGAVPFLGWILSNDHAKDSPHSAAALELLLADHVGSEAIGTVAAMLPGLSRTLGAKKVDDAIAKILATNEHGSVKARIYYARANLVLRDKSASDEAKAKAIAEMRKCIELDPNSDFGARAEGVLFEREHLQVGMPVPDIEGKDLDGVAFRLHDYKGKVIMLDFWGDW